MSCAVIYDAVPANDGDIEAPYKGEAVEAEAVTEERGRGGYHGRGFKTVAFASVVLGFLCLAYQFHCPHAVHQSGSAGASSSSSSLLRSGQQPHDMDHVSLFVTSIHYFSFKSF